MLMMGSIDGGLHPSRFTESPNGTRRDWTAQYEKVHAAIRGDAWLVGRITMAEMSKAQAHPPPQTKGVERPLHVAKRSALSFAVALDPGGKLHFSGDAVSGDHVIALLGRHVPEGHLAELTADGVSYIVCEAEEFEVASLLALLGKEFGIKHLVVEGGAKTNGSLLAAGVIDELKVLVAPALDCGEGAERIVAFPQGLAGRVKLTFVAAKALDHGVVVLTYKVSPR
jgi:riboflavin biosynthesis pyrimidine reductase